MTNTRYRNIYLDNHTHFCTASVVERLPLLSGDVICRAVLGVWKRQKTRYGVRLEGFVIMPDHIHILVRGNGEDVRKFLQYSMAEIARIVNATLRTKAARGDATAQDSLSTIRRRTNGLAGVKVWKERFRAVPLDSEDAIRVKLEYMHGNPVRGELASDPADWPWSSYAFYERGDWQDLVDCVFDP
jgi:putative transposase